MKDTESRESGKDEHWVDDAVSSDKDLPMRRSFSVEDLLDEVEKIGNVSTGENKVEIVVRLWKNGFTVNDEDLRSYSEDENQQFLEAIKRGEGILRHTKKYASNFMPSYPTEMPQELENSAEEEELEVNVEDLKEEMYVQRKKNFHPFTGRGYRLGSVAPRIIARSPSIHKEDSAPTLPSVSLNDTQPVTSLQIWLADGRRLVQKFNLSHRISDVRDFVQQSESSGSPFILTTSLPFRELRQPDLSLQEADLSNAVIVQRPLLSPSDSAN